jgi:membrane associated rhomboid family serine protease
MQFQLTPVVRNLIIINAVIFFGSLLTGMANTVYHTFALYSFLSPHFAVYQLVTHMFLHANFSHLLSNMLGLFFFGPLLERVWGSQRFLFFYFFCGLGAALLHSGIDYWEVSHMKNDAIAYQKAPTPDGFAEFFKQHRHDFYMSEEFYEYSNAFEKNANNPQIVEESKQQVLEAYRNRSENINAFTVGASGAIFGILMAFGLLFPNTEIFLYFLFPIKAKYFVALYGIWELVRGIRQEPGDSVAHFAHLGGMLFAYILIRYWGTKKNTFY